MDSLKLKHVRRRRRKTRVRKKVFGEPDRPRLTVTRSLRNFSAQIIDDAVGRTLAAASTQEKEFRSETKYGGNARAAVQLGKRLAERAKSAGIDKVSFDRNGYRYHGRVKAFADAVREAGIKL
jgi:large subunit ribosomal protein L18